jgi:hypothetical protein
MFVLPVTPLDWALYSVKNVCPVVGVFSDEDQTVALLTAIGEDNLREVKGACSYSRGKRELLNLECSIKYDSIGASSRRVKRQGSRLLTLSVKTLGLRALGFWVRDLYLVVFLGWVPFGVGLFRFFFCLLFLGVSFLYITCVLWGAFHF